MLQNIGTRSMLKMMILPLLAGLLLTFQNCAPAQVEVAGGVATTAQLSVAPGTSEEIESIFQTVLGRLPTASELAQYASLLSAGMSSEELQSQLAGSSTTTASLNALLQKYFTSFPTSLITTYQNMLKNGASMEQIEAMLKALTGKK